MDCENKRARKQSEAAVPPGSGPMPGGRVDPALRVAGPFLRAAAVAISLVSTLCAAPVYADEAASRSPEDLASEAYYVHSERCGQNRRSRTHNAEDELAVTTMWRDVSAGFDASKRNYLLYWRALLEQCLGKDSEAEQDLKEFLSRAATDPGSAGQVREGERRLKSLSTRRLQSEGKYRSPVVVGLDGGWSRAAAYDYVALGATLGIRAPRLLVVEAGVRVQLSGLLRDSAGNAVEPAEVAVYPVVVAGPTLVIDLRVRPVFGVLFQLGVNQRGDEGLPVMPGVAGVVGVEVPLRKGAPLALRVRAEAGVLERYPSIRALAGFTLGW